MPTYLFKDKNTLVETTIFMSISECDKYLEENPHIEQLVNGSPMIVDPIRAGIRKPDPQMREILNRVKKNHLHSTVNTF